MPAKNINLLTEQDFDHSIIGRFLRWSLTYGRYIIISTEIIVLLAFIYRFWLDRTITDLNEEIDQKSAIVAANQGFESRFRNLQFRTSQIASLAITQELPLTLIRHLETVTPSDIRFTTLLISNDTLSIDATANTSLSIGAFLESLKKSPYLRNVNVINLTRRTANSNETTFIVEAFINHE